jgi:hypothetical protein
MRDGTVPVRHEHLVTLFYSPQVLGQPSLELRDLDGLHEPYLATAPACVEAPGAHLLSLGLVLTREP